MSELQIKNDVETQGDFIRFLIKEVENAAFTDIEDVVPFVKWLDDELSYLVIDPINYFRLPILPSIVRCYKHFWM